MPANDPAYGAQSAFGMDPSTYGVNPTLAEAAATQISSASLSRFGAMPSPQFVWEGLRTNMPSTTLSAIQSAPDSAAPYITGLPAGSTPAIGQGSVPPPPPPTADQQAVFTFDWNQYWKQDNPQALGQDQNAGWKSFGEVPALNLAYMDGVRNQTDPSRIRKWQQMLKSQGWFNDPNYQVNGAWDKQTEAAFDSLMVSRAAPVALWSKDSSQQARANLLLSSLGIDSTELATQARSPDGLRSIVSGWMQSLGPDAHLGNQSELQLFADQFGAENLPDNWRQAMHSDTFFSFIGNGLGALGSLPVLGRGFDVLGNLTEGNISPRDLIRQPQSVAADQVRDALNAGDPTGNDAKLLTNAANQVNQDTGFLGLLDGYDRVRSRVGLSLFYLTGVLGGTAHGANPWDDLMSAWEGSAKYQDNPVAAFAGDKWAGENEAWASVLNFAVNTFDDPLTYLGPGLLKGGIKGTVKKGLTDAGQALVDQTAKRVVTDPHMTASLMREVESRGGHMLDHVEMLGAAGMTHDEIQKIVPKIQGALKAGSDHEAAALLSDDKEFRHIWAGVGSTFNRKNFWEMLSSVSKRDRLLSESKFNAMLQRMSYADTGPVAFLRHDPTEGLRNFDAVAQLAGVPADISKKHIDAILSTTDASHLPGLWQAAWGETLPEVWKFLESKGLTKDGLVQHQRMLRNIKDTSKVEIEHVYGANPDVTQAGTDLSKLTNMAPGKPDTFSIVRDQFRGLVDHHVAQVQDLENRLEKRLGKGWEAKAKEDPAMKPVLDQLEVERRQADELNRAHAGMDRSKPIWSYQLHDIFTMPVTPYELLSYSSPLLRTSEKANNFLKLNQMMSLWRRYAIGTISAAIHIAGGDDLLRIVSKQIMDGYPALAGKSIARFFGRAIGLATPGVRRQILEKIEEADRVMQINRVDFAKYAQDTDKNFFQVTVPGQHGYHDGLYRQVRSMRQSPDILAWLKAGDNPAERKAALAKWWKSDDPSAVAMRSQQGISGIATETKQMKAARQRLQQQVIERQHDMLQGFFAHDDLRKLAAGESDPTHAAIGMLLKHRLADTQQLPRATARRGKGLADKLTENDLLGELPVQPKPRTKSKEELLQKQPGGLPFIGGFKMNGEGLRSILRSPTAIPEMVFNGYTRHLVDSTRAQAAHDMVDDYMGALESLHGEVGALPAEQQLAEQTWRQNTAFRLARQWSDKNMYQMGRTLLGRSLRNHIPFWGATANQARFVTRVAAHSRIGGATFLRGGQASEKLQNSQSAQFPIFGSALSHLGFGGGDALTFDPMNFLFVTRDGLGSYMPGLGPLYTPLLNMIGHNTSLASAFGEMPWMGEQLRYHQGAQSVMFPWLAKLVQGGATAAGMPGLEQTFENLSGTSLFYGADQMQTKIDDKIRQMAREEGILDPNAAASQVGKEYLWSGALNFLLPVSANIAAHQQPFSDAMTTWRQATDASKQSQVVDQNLGAPAGTWQSLVDSTDPNRDSQILSELLSNPKSPGVMLAYLDRRLPSELRDQIANQPELRWVVAQTTSMYETTDKQAPASLAAFDAMRSSGNLHLLGGQEYISRISDNMQINQGWSAYENLKAQEQEVLSSVGGNTQDPSYVAWRNQVYEPTLEEYSNTLYPLWGKQYNLSPRRDTAGLSESTRPLRTLQTWEVMPWHQDAMNKTGQLWAQASKYQQEAGDELAALRQEGASKVEEQAVIDELNIRLQELSAQDPTFAQQISNFTYGKWDDVANYEASLQTALA